MQSVRLKKSFPSTFPLTFLRSARSRLSLNLASAFLILLSWAVPCRAQDTTAAPATTTQKYDVGLSGFYQVTGAANGNFIRDDTTESGGGMVSFRRPWRPWAGYEVNVGYTKFFESYNKNTVKVENNVTDVSFSYLFQSPSVYGVQPYFSLGGGIIVFSPISGTLTDVNSPATKSLPSQLLPEFAANFGLNYPIFSRLGVRGGMRVLEYKTPDFHQFSIDTKTLRTTLEPNLGVYYRF
jgi:hypothetical protein